MQSGNEPKRAKIDKHAEASEYADRRVFRLGRVEAIYPDAKRSDKNFVKWLRLYDEEMQRLNQGKAPTDAERFSARRAPRRPSEGHAEQAA